MTLLVKQLVIGPPFPRSILIFCDWGPRYLILLSVSRCFKYGRCLLLSHSSYLVVLLPPPMMLSLVQLLGQCGLWYSVHCRITICVEFLYSFYDHLILIYAAWSVCDGLASAFSDFPQAL